MTTAASSRCLLPRGAGGRGVDERGARAGEEQGGPVQVTMAVTMTRTGCGDFPAAFLAATRAGSRTSSRGSSSRMVLAPTRIASALARSASTSLEVFGA